MGKAYLYLYWMLEMSLVHVKTLCGANTEISKQIYLAIEAYPCY
jgi:hypothetical protein